MKQEDLLKCFFVYLCLLHVSLSYYEHECGQNPMVRMENTAEKLGISLLTLLKWLKTNQPQTINQLKKDISSYSVCIGRVDTGYFKRSTLASSTPMTPKEGRSAQGDLGNLPSMWQLTQSTGKRSRVQKLLSVMRSINGEAEAASTRRVGGDRHVIVDLCKERVCEDPV